MSLPKLPYHLLSGSVGANGGQNNPKDVMFIQVVLNAWINKYDILKTLNCKILVVNSQISSQLFYNIYIFQKAFVGMKKPDMRIDRNRNTIRMLIYHLPIKSNKVLNSRKKSTEKFKALGRIEAKKLGNSKFEEEFIQVIDALAKTVSGGEKGEGIQGGLTSLFLGSLNRPEDIHNLAKIFKMLKGWGLTFEEIRIVLWQMTFKTSAKDGRRIFEALSRSGSKLNKFIKLIGKVGKYFGIIVMIIKIINHFHKKEYSQIASSLYGYIVGSLVPLTGIIDGLEALVYEILGEHVGLKNNKFFQSFRVINIVGLGQVGIDTAVTLGQSVWDICQNGGDLGVALPRLEELVKRMKKSPAAVFVDIEQNVADLTKELGSLSAKDYVNLLNEIGKDVKDILVAAIPGGVLLSILFRDVDVKLIQRTKMKRIEMNK